MSVYTFPCIQQPEAITGGLQAATLFEAGFFVPRYITGYPAHGFLGIFSLPPFSPQEHTMATNMAPTVSDS